MATQEQAHERSRRVLELMQGRAAAEASGEVPAAAVEAAHARNAAFLTRIQALVADATASGAPAPHTEAAWPLSIRNEGGGALVDEPGRRPSLSVVIATRDAFSSLDPVLSAFVAQARGIDGEVVVVGGGGEEEGRAHDGLHFVPLATKNMLELRARALTEGRGQVIAIGEDHTLPAPDWATAVVRAHAEHPDVPVVVGCLVNRTVRRWTARGSFITYASDVVPPMPTLPRRPPPASTVSFKRHALGADAGVPGCLETELLPQLHIEGAMVADDRVILDHYQDFGFAQAVRQGFWVARASHGYARERLGWSKHQARAVARWSLVHVGSKMWAEARAGRLRTGSRRRDLFVVAFVATATALGAVVGALTGPGRSADRIS